MRPLNLVVFQYVYVTIGKGLKQVIRFMLLFLILCVRVCAMKFNVHKGPIPNVCYAGNA